MICYQLGPLFLFPSPEQWFSFRDAYMSRVDKTEDQVLKLFRGYQDQWNKYSESLDKSRTAGGPDIVKVHVAPPHPSLHTASPLTAHTLTPHFTQPHSTHPHPSLHTPSPLTPHTLTPHSTHPHPSLHTPSPLTSHTLTPHSHTPSPSRTLALHSTHPKSA